MDCCIFFFLIFELRYDVFYRLFRVTFNHMMMRLRVPLFSRLFASCLDEFWRLFIIITFLFDIYNGHLYLYFSLVFNDLWLVFHVLLLDACRFIYFSLVMSLFLLSILHVMFLCLWLWIYLILLLDTLHLKSLMLQYLLSFAALLLI